MQTNKDFKVVILPFKTLEQTMPIYSKENCKFIFDILLKYDSSDMKSFPTVYSIQGSYELSISITNPVEFLGFYNSTTLTNQAISTLWFTLFVF